MPWSCAFSECGHWSDRSRKRFTRNIDRHGDARTNLCTSTPYGGRHASPKKEESPARAGLSRFWVTRSLPPRWRRRSRLLRLRLLVPDADLVGLRHQERCKYEADGGNEDRIQQGV